MSNILNSGSLDTLKSGQCLLVGSRRVSNGKVQLEFAEVLEGASQSNNNALAAFNASDDRFSATKARRAWMTAEPVDASELLGVDLTGGYTTNEMGREVKSLNVINPEALGKALRVQITETVEPTEWQMGNLETSAKRRGKDGDYITHKGMYIFANTNVVFGEPKHTFLEADAPATAGGGIIASQSVDVATGEILS